MRCGSPTGSRRPGEVLCFLTGAETPLCWETAGWPADSPEGIHRKKHLCPSAPDSLLPLRHTRWLQPEESPTPPGRAVRPQKAPVTPQKLSRSEQHCKIFVRSSSHKRRPGPTRYTQAGDYLIKLKIYTGLNPNIQNSMENHLSDQEPEK